LNIDIDRIRYIITIN